MIFRQLLRLPAQHRFSTHGHFKTDHVNITRDVDLDARANTRGRFTLIRPGSGRGTAFAFRLADAAEVPATARAGRQARFADSVQPVVAQQQRIRPAQTAFAPRIFERIQHRAPVEPGHALHFLAHEP